MKFIVALLLALLGATGALAQQSGPSPLLVGMPVLNGVTGQVLSESLSGALQAGAVTPAANASGLSITGYSLTGSNAQPAINVAGTWNTTGTPTALQISVTNTASNTASLLASFQVGGTTEFSVQEGGQVFANNRYVIGSYSSPGLYLSSGQVGLPNSGVITWSSSSSALGTTDTALWRNAAGILSQRNGLNSQALQVDNSFTDVSDYEAGVLDWQATTNTLRMGAIAAGTGTQRAVYVPSAGLTLGNAPATVSAGEVAMPKITSPGTAPGAGFGKMEWVAGTNAGTCKLIAYAGTSTTPVTIVDNVGSGC